ncbi:MAG: hypothetical protein ACP6IU_11030 [Candidatus Asgardarchaeia archaeon]
MSNKHKDCINYENGICKRFGIPVDPEGIACPNFIPKSQVSDTLIQRTQESYINQTPYVRYPMIYRLGSRNRRRLRRGRHRW